MTYFSRLIVPVKVGIRVLSQHAGSLLLGGGPCSGASLFGGYSPV
jgi:hypothetical protein